MDGIQAQTKPACLSNLEQALVRDSWSEVYKNHEDTGVDILLRFFQRFPSAQQLFSQFRETQEPAELRQSVELRRHSRRVMGALQGVVGALEEPGRMGSALEQMAHSHAVRHGVQPHYFQMLCGVILEVLCEKHPESFSVQVRAAWSRVMELLLWHVEQTYTQLGWSR